MSNLTETATFTTSLRQIERSEPWDVGAAGDGNAQEHAVALGNRTKYLKARLDNYHFQDFSSVTVPDNTLKWFDGSAYGFPMTSPVFTTPNDGITRDYEINLNALCDFTYNSSGNVLLGLALDTTVIAASAVLRYPYQSLSYRKVVSIGPNVGMKAVLSNNSTGASAVFSAIQFSIKQL